MQHYAFALQLTLSPYDPTNLIDRIRISADGAMVDGRVGA